MSVLINMDMPKNCLACRFLETSPSNGDFCVLTKRKMFRFKNRPDDCPLIEVPEPHGRLIDADALLSLDRQIYDGEIAVGRREYIFCFEVEDAPTVIPAEEGE